jgi:hypothetical protein
MIEAQLEQGKQKWYNPSVKITASALGALAGVSGLISGYYEILQGDLAPSGLWNSFIGPSYSMYDNGVYEVLTVVPSFHLTGLLAMVVSSVALVWALGFLHRKHGAPVMLLLAVTQCLVGGAWVLDLGIFTSILATRINNPLDWWRTHLPEKAQKILAQLWPWSVVAYSILSVMLLGATVLGVDNKSVVDLVIMIASAMIIPIPLMIVGGIARDIQQRMKRDQKSHVVSHQADLLHNITS